MASAPRKRGRPRKEGGVRHYHLILREDEHADIIAYLNQYKHGEWTQAIIRAMRSGMPDKPEVSPLPVRISEDELDTLIMGFFDDSQSVTPQNLDA